IERRLKEVQPFSVFGVQDLSVESNLKGFEDVANYDELKAELIESIKTPLENPKIAYAYGLKPPKGLLLFGPPGTGKTYLMKALAKELNFPFLYVKTSQLLSPYYGESEKNVSQIFELARKKAPVVLFFDEIDAIAKKRAGGGLDEVTPRVLNTLLQELEGVVSKKPIIFVAATNVPNMIDPALLRPGRIDKVIYMGVPDERGRELLFKYYINQVPNENIDFKKLAKMTERYTPADISNVVQEAKRIAAKRASKTGNIEPITMNDLEGIIKITKPSVSASLLEEHEQFKLEFERKTSKEKEEKPPELTFSDVADMEDVKKTLKEAIELPLKYGQLIEEFQLRPPKGLLLFGPPGTGKTYIMKAAAGEFKVPIIFLSGAELLKKGYYEAATVLKEAFNRAKDNAPSIIFIDEIETVAPARTGMSNPLMGQLLQEMDGLKNLKNVIVVGATNLPQTLDPALLRPGRFDRIIYIPPPSKEVRKQIFAIHLGKFSSSFDLDYLANATEGYSSADIKALCEEIKLKLFQKSMQTGKKIDTLTKQELSSLLAGRKPSITKDLLFVYEKFIKEYGERK
ncbi:MAG: AAA family ATPase, partial [Candidatus Anstonellales archaeon]